jgi:hypothetical protein
LIPSSAPDYGSFYPFLASNAPSDLPSDLPNQAALNAKYQATYKQLTMARKCQHLQQIGGMVE